MFEWLSEIDSNVFLFFNSLRSGFFDHFFHLFSGRFIWIPMYAAILYTFYRSFNWKQATIFVVCVAIAITLTDQIGASLLRPMISRPRPFHPDSPISELAILVDWYTPGGSYGFPSCHAANTVALALIVSLWLKRWSLTLFMFLWALVTCYSRIYLAAHYPGDLVAGSFLGLLVGWAIYCFSIWINRRVVEEQYIPRERMISSSGLFKTYYVSNSIIVVGILTIMYMIIISL